MNNVAIKPVADGICANSTYVRDPDASTKRIPSQVEGLNDRGRNFPAAERSRSVFALADRSGTKYCRINKGSFADLTEVYCIRPFPLHGNGTQNGWDADPNKATQLPDRLDLFERQMF